MWAVKSSDNASQSDLGVLASTAALQLATLSNTRDNKGYKRRWAPAQELRTTECTYEGCGGTAYYCPLWGSNTMECAKCGCAFRTTAAQRTASRYNRPEPIVDGEVPSTTTDA